jgi:hypothetical protein
MTMDVTQTLESKARLIADELTPKEWARLAAMRPEEVAGALSPALRAKVQQVASELTEEEATQLRLLLEGIGTGAATETVGYAVAVYEGDAGNKGRPQPGTPANAAGRDPAHVIPDTLGVYVVPAFWPLIDLVRAIP